MLAPPCTHQTWSPWWPCILFIFTDLCWCGFNWYSHKNFSRDQLYPQYKVSRTDYSQTISNFHIWYSDYIEKVTKLICKRNVNLRYFTWNNIVILKVGHICGNIIAISWQMNFLWKLILRSSNSENSCFEFKIFTSCYVGWKVCFYCSWNIALSICYL